MTTLDAACLAVVVLAAIGGAVLGALTQLAQLGAVSAGWAGARWLGPTVAPFLQGKVPAFAAHPIASALAFAACAAAAMIVLHALVGLARARRAERGGMDRGLGALLGGTQAALVVWVGLSALAAWGKPVHVGRFHVDPTGSDLVGFAREHSALAPLAPRAAERGVAKRLRP